MPPGNPRVVPPDCPFDILSASSSGSASRLLIVSGLTGCVVNAEVPCAADRKATTPAISISVLFIGVPSVRDDCTLPGGSVIPLDPSGASQATGSKARPANGGERALTPWSRRFRDDPCPHGGVAA